MSKYIIDVGDAYAKHICGKGDMLCLPVRINEFEDDWLNTNIPLTPYTEPDTEKVREEAFKNGYDAACNDIDIKSKTSAAYQKGYQDATAKISSDEQAIAEKVYQSGLNDAWEAARKISMAEINGRCSWKSMKNIFGIEIPSKIFKNFTASEAIETLKACEQEQGAEIKVGNEVISPNGKGVVTEITDIYVHIMYAKGSGQLFKSEDLIKTGRHFPELAEVLRKMEEK